MEDAALIAAWELWKMHNDKVFQRCDPTPSAWLANFKNFVFGLMLLVNPCL
jgi:hypothetical protein